MKPTSVAFTMPRLSQACLLGYTPSPQQAFQGDAAHQAQRRTWLTPNDSRGTWYTPKDYRSSWTLRPFHRTVFTAHTWSALPPFLGACATVVMPASMCEDVVKDDRLAHLAIGGDMHLHCRPSTASVTTRKDQAYRERMGTSPLNPGACDRWSQSCPHGRRSYGFFEE